MLNLLVTAVDLDDIKTHVVVKQVIDVEVALYITQIDHCEEKLRHPHPCHPLGRGWGAQRQNREYGVSRGRHHRIEF